MARLTIPDEDTSASFPVTSPTSVFPVDFALFEKADLVVSVDDVLLGQSGFTFSGTLLDGGGYQGGTVTLNTAVDDCTVLVRRIVNPLRPSNFGPVTSVPVRAIDMALNRLTATQQDLRREIGRIQFDGLTGGLDAAGAREAIGADLENIEYQRDAAGAVALPAILKMQQQYDLVDFIDRQYWPTIAAYGDAPLAVFKAAYAAAVENLPDSAYYGVKCGAIRFPSGRCRFDTIGVSGAIRLIGDGGSTEVRATNPVFDLFDVYSYFAEIHDMRITSEVNRTSGRYVSLRNGLAPRFAMTNVLAQDPFHFFIANGNPADPNQHLNVIYMEDVTVRDSKPGATVFQFDSGLAVSLVEILTENSLVARPAHCLRVRNAGDINIRDCQWLAGDYGLLVDPGPGQEVNSLSSAGTYYDNCFTAGIEYHPNGGKVGGATHRGDWSSSTAGGWGVRARTTGAGVIDGLSFSDHQSHLNAQDGATFSGNVRKLRYQGWNAQNAGAGFSTGAPLDGFEVDAVLGPWRNLTGNAFGAVIAAGSDHFRLKGDYRGNTTNLSNGAGVSATRVVEAWT